MSITVNIYYTGTNGSARKFAEEMTQSGVVADIRAEDGNLKYEYFFPMDDPETVLLIDRWRDQEAIDAQKYDLHMKVERMVSDESDILTRDQQFIKN